MKLLGSTENKITKDKRGENVLHLKITEVVLVHCHIVNNDYQQDSRGLYMFVPNKPFASLLDISPTNHIFAKDRIDVKEYGFLSFAKNMGKNLRNKYGKKLLDS